MAEVEAVVKVEVAEVEAYLAALTTRAVLRTPGVGLLEGVLCACNGTQKEESRTFGKQS